MHLAYLMMLTTLLKLNRNLRVGLKATATCTTVLSLVMTAGLRRRVDVKVQVSRFL